MACDDGHQKARARRLWALVALLCACAVTIALAAPIVPEEIEQPGTQPLEVGPYTPPEGGGGSCISCHGGTSNPAFEPYFGWKGSMMAHSARDPLFWAQLAVAEQDFIPDADPAQRGGAGDLCLRCHMPGGWLQGRSKPTDGSAMSPATDAHGVECEHCHLLVNPDPPVNVPLTIEEQTAPFIANDGSEGFYGSGMYVINSEGSRLGPYDDAAAPHSWLQSAFHREPEVCGTCHDVSNPAVGDLAHNNGAQTPLAPELHSGILGGDIEDKAAFNNPPYMYGIVERTFSELKSSALSSLRVDDFPSLPDELRVTGGALQIAYERAFNTNTMTADYADGTPRYFTCQTCHMSAAEGVGCNVVTTPVRTDLPRHDLTGSGYWVPQMIMWQDDAGTLRFGGPVDSATRAAMDAGMLRAEAMLASAAKLETLRQGEFLNVRVINLAGHKLITGYPEGRRMWLNIRWLDDQGALIQEEGAYGQIGRAVQDLDGDTFQVESILDLANTVIFEAGPGLDQQWASQLLGLSYDPAMALAYDRMTDQVVETLGSLAAKPAGSSTKTFHFVLNNVLVDNRIPPYGMGYDEAKLRNALPAPAAQYGNPGPGGTYEHWNTSQWAIPPGAVTAEVYLYYQQTSWEYIQFLWLQNDGQNAFLGQEGVNLLDAWLNTGMSPPFEMASTTVDLLAPSNETTLSVPSCMFDLPGATVWVPVEATPADGFLGVDLELQYDAALLNAVVVSTTPLSAGCGLAWNVVVPGTVDIALYCTTELSGSGPLVEVQFDVVGTLGEQSALDLVSAEVNEGAIVATLVDGTFMIDDILAPTESPLLTMIKEPSGWLLTWSATGDASEYDVVKGDLDLLLGSSGGFDVATQACVADDLGVTSVTDSDALAGVWYLVRGSSCGVGGSYDSPGVGQTASRDAGVEASGSACP
jgi:hypothetical protein